MEIIFTVEIMDNKYNVLNYYLYANEKDAQEARNTFTNLGKIVCMRPIRIL